MENTNIEKKISPETSDSKDYGCPLSFEVIKVQNNFLRGDILTIIDASFSDLVQRKAVKDLVHSAFEKKQRHYSDLCFDPRGSLAAACLEAPNNGKD